MSKRACWDPAGLNKPFLFVCSLGNHPIASCFFCAKSCIILKIYQFVHERSVMLMDGIDAILQAEKEAERIRREARIEADALLGSAEGYRERAIEAARREGEDEKQRLMEEARKRAEDRMAELRVVAEVKNAELRAEAEKKLDETAKMIAERIAGF